MESKSRILFVNDGSKDKTWEITISIDCDRQDDINAMNEMVEQYLQGAEVVYNYVFIMNVRREG